MDWHANNSRMTYVFHKHVNDDKSRQKRIKAITFAYLSHSLWWFMLYGVQSKRHLWFVWFAALIGKKGPFEISVYYAMEN